jgi:hypothetical protein
VVVFGWVPVGDDNAGAEMTEEQLQQRIEALEREKEFWRTLRVHEMELHQLLKDWLDLLWPKSTQQLEEITYLRLQLTLNPHLLDIEFGGTIECPYRPAHLGERK